MNLQNKTKIFEIKVPEHVFERYKEVFNFNYLPNIVRTKNITKDGLDILISKNNLIWSTSIFTDDYNYIEGMVTWGKEKVLIYFKRVDNDNSFIIFLLTDTLDSLTLLIKGLNKYFTIDQI